ncbi:transcription factor C6 like [Lecanosticta acicola]|uniref:Transcription factor C6 like n=1 Tax=Lecanosticta acicola TaxID=111012 RepID=A0AAI8Z9G5_9PEZI|nr:transcription factor C6 like [Lecanosticta acicola]
MTDRPGSQRRPDAYPPAPVQPDYRPQTQNLPRLHDILTSQPPAPSPSAYGSNWAPTTGPPHHPQQHPNGEGYHGHHTGWHPPLAHPPHDGPQTYPSQQGRRLELPILETSPIARRDSHSVPLSPYPPHHHHEGAREYNEMRRERPRQASTSSYHPNGVLTPYTPAGPDGSHYRSPATSLDRPSSNALAPAGPESSKKYLGVRDVAGEGPCHMYEGGFRIPTHVDGEAVNPAWGLTKANKPRKRLAMACLDCREKKIKCEPGLASCLQCEKAKRPCRKAPTHQSTSEPNTTPVWQGHPDSPSRQGYHETTPPSARETESADVSSKRRTLEEPSPSGLPTKRHRSASPVGAQSGVGAMHVNGTHQVSPIMPRSPGKVLAWEEDPFALEPEMTMHLLDLFFAYVNNATYGIFPRHHFMRWVTSYAEKCQNERTVLYALMAVGSIFADDRYSGVGKHCAQVANEALLSKIGRFSMSLAQTRLLLGLYHFAKGANNVACDYVSSGINVAVYLRLHTERGCFEEETAVEKSRNEFAFTKEQLVECKRRTMWTCFLMDHYCGATHNLMNSQDIFIRLPCTEDTFECGLASNAPQFDNGITDPATTILTPSSAVSPMAWLVLIAAIWGNVYSFTHRATHRSASTYESEYEKFYEETRANLENWAARLPEALQLTKTNVEGSVQRGYGGPFISMHVLYHLAWLKMNRFARHEHIPKSIARNVRTAHRHAHELLQVMSLFRAAKWEIMDKEGHQASFLFTMPFAGYAILAAIDVIGAGGLDSNLTATLDLISCGLDCLRELGRYWDSARDQEKACEKRYYQIHNVLKHPFTARSGCWLGREWGVHSSLEREFALEDDCIYGVSDRDYFDALKDDTVNGRAPNGNGLRGIV